MNIIYIIKIFKKKLIILILVEIGEKI